MRSHIGAGLLALAIPALSIAETSEPEAYAGGSLGVTVLEFDELPNWDQRYAVASLRLGAKLHKHISIEARIGKGLNTYEDSEQGVNTETELKHYYGGFVKFTIGDDVRPYALLGYNKVRIGMSATNGALTISDAGTEDDAAFGLGIEFDTGKHYMLNVECLNQYSDSDATINGCSVGFGRWF